MTRRGGGVASGDVEAVAEAVATLEAAGYSVEAVTDVRRRHADVEFELTVRHTPE